MARVEKVARALEEAFGPPTAPEPRDPLDGLILTILSQNTSDRNRDRAFQSLKNAFPEWEAALKAGPRGVQDAIRVGGLSGVKARRIVKLLGDLQASGRGLTLEGLRRLQPEDAESFLLSIRGVGKKTARCVLLFDLGIPAFPVDTHILRITRRLGWIPQRTGAERAHDLLAKIIPQHRMLDLHLNLIRLGRTLCRPATPRCGACPILGSCRFGTAVTAVRKRLACG